MRDVEVPSQEEARETRTGRIVLFPRRLGGKQPRRADAAPEDAPSEVADLRKYEQDSEPDDYPRRMMVNAAAFAFIVVLTLAGVWLAEQMALLRKTQDCAFAGRKTCPEATTHTPAR